MSTMKRPASNARTARSIASSSSGGRRLRPRPVEPQFIGRLLDERPVAGLGRGAHELGGHAPADQLPDGHLGRFELDLELEVARTGRLIANSQSPHDGRTIAQVWSQIRRHGRTCTRVPGRVERGTLGN